MPHTNPSTGSGGGGGGGGGGGTRHVHKCQKDHVGH